jgi:hypothetical protein
MQVAHAQNADDLDLMYCAVLCTVLQVVQMKKYQKEQEDIKHIKEFIASCGESRQLVGGCGGHNMSSIGSD